VVPVKGLATRPSSARSELHGLYTRDARGRVLIRVWMRTAARSEVVKTRTFMRTFLHEVCHHLDYELFRLEDSLHTEGFFKRESSLMRQILPKGATKARCAPARRTKALSEAEPAMDLGPNPAEAIMAMLKGKTEPDVSRGAASAAVRRTTRQSPEPESDPEPPEDIVDEGWWRELDEPSPGASADFDSEPQAEASRKRVYDPGFDAEVVVAHTEEPQATLSQEPGQKSQTTLPF